VEVAIWSAIQRKRIISSRGKKSGRRVDDSGFSKGLVEGWNRIRTPVARKESVVKSLNEFEAAVVEEKGCKRTQTNKCKDCDDNTRVELRHAQLCIWLEKAAI
jgi:hypothetical protein